MACWKGQGKERRACLLVKNEGRCNTSETGNAADFVFIRQGRWLFDVTVVDSSLCLNTVWCIQTCITGISVSIVGQGKCSLFYFDIVVIVYSQSRWPRGLRRGSAAARLLVLRV